MRARASIIWLVATIAVLVALMLWFGKRKSAEPSVPASAETTTAPPVAPTADQPPASSPTAPVQASPSDPKEQQMREGLSTYNDRDVFLHGQVIDQFGSPVADARVGGTIQVNNGTRVGTDRTSTTTDGNGFFTISGYRGENLGIQVTKSGYVMSATNTSFVFSLLWPEARRPIPDPSRPIVVKMWKLQGAEPLVNISKEYKLLFTSRAINFDLVGGNVVSNGGDIKITVNRPAGEVSEHSPQKWSINFEVVEGGFIETSSRESAVTFAAPEGDYQPNGVFGNNNGTDGLDRTFFVESRNGRVFSKFHLSLGINNSPDGFLYITFRGVANTNGSRNWEATAPP